MTYPRYFLFPLCLPLRFDTPTQGTWMGHETACQSFDDVSDVASAPMVDEVSRERAEKELGEWGWLFGSEVAK